MIFLSDSDFMVENAVTMISKKYEMTIGSKSGIEVILYKTINIVSGFREAVLLPLSLTDMQWGLKFLMDSAVAGS